MSAEQSLPKELTAEVPFLRPEQHENREGVGAPESGALAFANPDETAAAFRMVAQDKAGLPRLPGAAADDISLEIVIERDNFLPACFLDIGALRSRAVCQVKASGKNFREQNGQWSGTGFLVADNILLTNHHVLNSPEVAGHARCIFNFQVDEEGKAQPTKGFQLNPERLFLTSGVDQLDFTFVWVDGEPGKEFGHVPLHRSSFSVVNQEYANIIQHPAGRPKTVVLQESTVEWQDTVVTHYTSDTEPGSSGSCVFNNQWRPIALHHASRPSQDPRFRHLNEGIKLAAIAAYLERLTETADAAAARELLALFRGTDPMMGFFGALGRTTGEQKTGVEAVVDSYRGEAADIDAGFWNVEWFARRYEEKVDAVADIVARMNLDIWALVESSPAAAQALVDRLKTKYRMDFGVAHSEPNAPTSKQSTSVIWNKKTVAGKRQEWPAPLEQWWQLRSEDFDSTGLEAIEGKIFDRYPGLFHFTAKNRERGQAPFDFFLVPLHLKAMAEGSKRREMAAKMLAAAVKRMKEEFGCKEQDWVIGGDYNAELATGDFDAMLRGGLVALSAADEAGGAMSYLKSPRSLIDHVFLSANLARTYGEDDYFIVAAEKPIPDYVKQVSDHRPVLVRLSLKDQVEAEPPARKRATADVPEDLRQALGLGTAATAAPAAAPGRPLAIPTPAGGAGVMAKMSWTNTPGTDEPGQLVAMELEARQSDFEVPRATDVYIPLLKASYDLAHGISNPPLPGNCEVLGEVRSHSLEALEAPRALKAAERRAIENDRRALELEAGEHDEGFEADLAAPDAFGWVVRDRRSGDVIVSIRGTQTPGEWAKNFTAVPNPFNRAPEFGLVHLGFEIMWERVRDSVFAALQRVPAETRVTVLGHSLGGAMATLGAVDIRKSLGRTNLDVCTVGGPRVGQLKFRANFNRTIERCFRLTNQGDIVPHVPPVFLLFSHAGLEIGVTGRNGNPHSLDAYLSGLRALRTGPAATEAGVMALPTL